MTVGFIGIVVNIVGRIMKKDKSNIFESPMQLRNWAVKLIDQLGSPLNKTAPNTREVDKLLAQFVGDYNYQYDLQTEKEEE